MGKVIFVGAGPGAPDLITLRGQQVIAKADVVIYAGSLVNPEILSHCRKDAKIYNSALMTLPEVIGVMKKAAAEDKLIARVHTGDPSLYGAEQEQMHCLDEEGIPYEVVPGVSSFLAAAASLRCEYTLPGVSQSLILTRMEGRTAVPERESIESLAAHQTSMAIFLSVGDIEKLCERLMRGGYAPDTPAAVVYRASWPDEKKVEGELSDLAGKVKEAGIDKTALVLVGRFLKSDFENSKLYDENFSHSFRTAADKKVPSAGYHSKRLMIQGTMSSAGKSFVTAALCRIFRQDGYKVAPFKSQNMALNSYVSAEGLEISRAQAMQAEAAGTDAVADLNPILLKPTGDEESQVIVRGEVLGNMSASEYYEKKADLILVIEGSFRRLSDSFDIVVIEGAGSPAEINLRENDIVNMGMARMADSPVILVADIDRGGVFAQIVGTVELLEPDERARIKGIIINKFRGDKDLLRPGIEPVEKRLGIPVLGIIPMAGIDLDEEDSLAPRLENRTRSRRGEENDDDLKIDIIRFPHISNFTDFSVLERWEGITVTYVADRKDLGKPDIIILPGTKNTMADLEWLEESGLCREIRDLYDSEETIVTGICGGYQMLGYSLSDPDGVEQDRGKVMEGMGLLPLTTVFEGNKTRSRSQGRFTDEAYPRQKTEADPSLRTVTGYEIHMGRTEPVEAVTDRSAFPFIILSDGRNGGWVSADGRCFGTYLHGLFDNVEWTEYFLGCTAAARKKTPPKMAEDVISYKERQYDELADLVRCSLDMDAIYRIMNESGAGKES